MNKYLFLSAILLFTGKIFAGIIPQSGYTVQYVSSDNPTRPVASAFDGDTTTFWAIWNSAGFSLPATVEVDLGGTYDVDGFSYTPNPNFYDRKVIGYELYLSTDGTNWGTPEIVGDFVWANDTDVYTQDIFFGAITAQYVKVVYTTNNNSTTDNVHTSELVFHESSTPATGQQNQSITFAPISKKSSTNAPFSLSATSSSGLTAMTYSVVSGPASINGNTLTLTGSPGTVTLKAEQLGDASYYPAETFQQFEVIDLSTYYPTVSSRLTEDYPIEMPSLNAYPIYLETSIDEPDFISIDRVEIDVDGTQLTVIGDNGFYYAFWTPSANGFHNVNIKSIGTNGNSTTLTKNVEVTDVVNTQNVQTMDDVVIQFNATNSRWYYGTYTMPQHVGSYDQLIANMIVECPTATGNCDDWDRRANIDVKGPDGNWIQIIRYITPYGVGCSHTIDLTDYASLLQGEIEFRMFIDTWGTGGWQISLDFDFQQGTPTYLYSNIDELWDGSWDLGNPSNLQPVDTIAYTYPDNILSSHLRLSTTGHGWGSNNSQNAAEFYEANNYIDVDGVQAYNQHLWNDCNPNPDGCTGQLGTWTYNRAGWCPGAIAHPDTIDMTTQIANKTVQFTYRLDPTYTDFCHPDNPSCVTGVTCPDCNDGFKAQYHVDGQLINFSNNPLPLGSIGIEEVDNTTTYDLAVYPNPTNGIFQISTPDEVGESVVHVQTITGEVLKTYYFDTTEQLNSKKFDLSSVSTGTYFITIENNAGQGVSKLVIQ